MYMYKTITVNIYADDFDDVLNSWAMGGWRIVSVILSGQFVRVIMETEIE